MSNWLPMDTAPKDGTLIDLWTSAGRETDVFWCFSRDASGAPLPEAHDPFRGWARSKGDTGRALPNLISSPALAWMPIPAPPEAAP